MGKKKVTFSSRVKVVTDSGSIHYEQDWGASPFDLLGQSENFDFIQEQFEQKLSMLGYSGKEDLDRLQELTMPMFQCANNAVHKIGAVEYLKLLANAPQQACGPVPTPTNSNKTRGMTVAMLSEKKSRKSLKDKAGKKRGILGPKDIPGRDTPEQRKMRLMTSKPGPPKVFQKISKLKPALQCPERQDPPRDPSLKTSGILKVSKNEYDDAVIIDLTAIDDASIHYGTEDEDEDADAREDCWWDDDHSDEERESSEREDLRDRIATSTQDSSECSLGDRNPSPRLDPPSFDEFAEHKLPSKKPDPTASYHHQESAKELSFTSACVTPNLYGKRTHAKPKFSCE